MYPYLDICMYLLYILHGCGISPLLSTCSIIQSCNYFLNHRVQNKTVEKNPNLSNYPLLINKQLIGESTYPFTYLHSYNLDFVNDVHINIHTYIPLTDYLIVLYYIKINNHINDLNVIGMLLFNSGSVFRGDLIRKLQICCCLDNLIYLIKQ